MNKTDIVCINDGSILEINSKRIDTLARYGYLTWNDKYKVYTFKLSDNRIVSDNDYLESIIKSKTIISDIMNYRKIKRINDNKFIDVNIIPYEFAIGENFIRISTNKIPYITIYVIGAKKKVINSINDYFYRNTMSIINNKKILNKKLFMSMIDEKGINNNTFSSTMYIYNKFGLKIRVKQMLLTNNLTVEYKNRIIKKLYIPSTTYYISRFVKN